MSVLSQSPTFAAHDMVFPSTFPPEIEDYIIDQLHYDVEPLRQCALTCSRWLLRSRCHLVVVVRVRTMEQLFSFCAFITQYTHVRPFVRSVTLRPERDRPESVHLIETIPVPLLTLLPNLTCWSLFGDQIHHAKGPLSPFKLIPMFPKLPARPEETIYVDWKGHYSMAPCHRMALACIRRHATTIQELHLSSVSFPASIDCARLVLSFPALRSLHGRGIFMETSQKIPDAWMKQYAGRADIRSLSVSACCVCAIES